MDSTTHFHPGCLIFCPGCGADVHADEALPGDEGHFLCVRCRERNNARVAEHLAMEAKRKENKRGKGITNRDLPNPTAPSRSRKGGSGSAQQQPTLADDESIGVDQPRDSGEIG